MFTATGFSDVCRIMVPDSELLYHSHVIDGRGLLVIVEYMNDVIAGNTTSRPVDIEWSASCTISKCVSPVLAIWGYQKWLSSS